MKRLVEKIVFNILKVKIIKRLSEMYQVQYFNQLDFKKTALVSYKTLNNCELVNTAELELSEIIKILAKMDYKITLVNCSNKYFACGEVYDLVVGFGFPYYNNSGLKKIFLMTEGPQNIAKKLEKEELNVLKTIGIKKRSVITRSCKVFEEKDYMNENIIIYGSDVKRWQKIIDGSYFIYPTGFEPIIKKSDITKLAFNNLLWFGSSGIANKAVRETISIAKEIKIDLFLVGINPKEEVAVKKIVEYYDNDSVQIFNYVSVYSTLFRSIIKKNPICLFPSYSEASSTSVLTLLRNGIICIVSGNCGFSNELPGLYICNNRNEYIRVIKDIMSLSSEEVYELRLRAYDFANRNFDIASFGKNIESIINEISH